MLKYKGTFITVFPFLMKKNMVEQYGKRVTKDAFKKAPKLYKQMLNEVEDIGSENPMAGNIYMAFVFMAIWKAADGAIDVDSYRTVVRNFLTKSFARKFIGKSNMNNPEDVQKAKEKFRRMQAWADEHPQYKDKTWDFNFDESKHKDGSFYYFTRCPLNDYARKYGFMDVLPVCCELDHIITEASKGRLIREYTLAGGGPMCDYWIVGDQLKNPE